MKFFIFVILFTITFNLLHSEIVVLQPGEEGKDTYICDCSPNTNNPNGPITHLYQGQYGTCFDRTLIEWDISLIPTGVQILSAVMELDFNTIHGSASGQMVYYVITEPWEETEVTFNTQPAYNTEMEVITDWPEPNTWHTIDITDFVQYWIDYPVSNFGVYCHCLNTTGTSCAEFNSSDHSDPEVHPKLTINYGSVDVSEDIIDSQINFFQNYPNPFNPTTTIRFECKEDTFVNLTIYNVKEQHVKSLYVGKLNAGQHSMIWNGKDDNNKELASGIYYIKLSANSKDQIRKTLLMK